MVLGSGNEGVPLLGIRIESEKLIGNEGAPSLGIRIESGKLIIKQSSD